MRLSALIWNRYRSFRERQKVLLAPITVIIGRNGSGKSIISRLPLLLAGGISGDTPGPIDLMAGGVEHAASYQDLVNMRGALPFSLGAEIKGTEGVFAFETTMRHMNETQSLAIEGFQLSKDGVEILRADISTAEQLTEVSPTYFLTIRGVKDPARSVTFSGLFPTPECFEAPLGVELNEIISFFRLAMPQPSYLGPFRAEPGSTTRAPSQGVQNLGPAGSAR